jgi:hypothetical protein
MSILIAIDPGAGGGIAVWRDGQPIDAVPMPPTEGDVLNLLRQLAVDPANTVAVVEEVGGYVGKAQPASGAFKFGRNFGFILGVLQALGVRVQLAPPALAEGPRPGQCVRLHFTDGVEEQAQRMRSAAVSAPETNLGDGGRTLDPGTCARRGFAVRE